MIATLAEAVMRLAVRCLGESGREWALAMQGEFAAAVEGGRPLGFAIGCMIAAWRRLPVHQEGRFVLANHALAFGLLIPMAGCLFACAAGSSSFFGGQPGPYAVLAPGGMQDPYSAEAHGSAIPTLLALWLMLGAGHLRLAWVVLERDWSRRRLALGIVPVVHACIEPPDGEHACSGNFAVGAFC